MSSQHSKVSAYRVYSSQGERPMSQNLAESERLSSTRKSKSKSKRRHKERPTDSDDEVLKISKHSSSPPNKSGRKYASLMDLNFSRKQKGVKRRKCASSSSSEDGNSSSESNHRKDWRRSSYHSESEESDIDTRHSPDRGGKVKRTWKESSYKVSNSPNPLPLVVEMPHRSRSSNSSFSFNAHKQPKSLFDPNILPHKRNRKPVSLLDLPMSSTDRKMHHYDRRQYPPAYPRQMHTERGQGDNRQDRRGWVPRRDNIDNEREAPRKRMKFMRNVPKMETVQDVPRITACCDSKHSFVIIPSTCPTTGIHGRASVTLLMGSVTILGYQLEQGCSYSVYSPDMGGLLSVVARGEHLKDEDVKDELTKHGFSDLNKKFRSLGNNSIAVLLVKKLESALCDYITSFAPYTQLFNPALPKGVLASSENRGVTLHKVGLKIAPHEEFVVGSLNMSKEYQDVLDKWKKWIKDEDTKPPVFLSCGTKNSGKSTFNRMLINSALQSGDAVAYLECDCGQTEFSPPCTLSLHIVTEPILGPPFCHQKQAERMVFFGDVSPNVDPGTYIKCLTHVFQAYSELVKPLPLIVNTMGWTEGLGVMLLIDTVNITKPDVVVQIDSYNQASNLPAITHERIALDPGWTFNKSPAEDPKQKMEETHKHDLFLLMTLASERGTRESGIHMKLKPVDLRNLALLSSLSLGLERSLTLTSVPPYAVPYNQLAIHVCHHNVTGSELLTAVDTSVVALCVADTSQLKRDLPDMPFVFEKMPMCECLGLGIVRGVDTSKGVLYLVTTLPGCILRNVNTLLKGSLSLPDQLILKQKSTGPLPYVDALAPSTAMTGLRQRARMPRMSKRTF